MIENLTPNNELNEQQIKLLNGDKEEQFLLKREIHRDIFPIMVEGFRQIRELTQNIAIISGAIAAFTIPILNTDLVQTKVLAYIALLLLFISIVYAIHHLSEVISKEVNDLSKQHSTYNDILDDAIDRVNTVLLTGNIDKLNVDEKKVLKKLSTIKILPKIDRSLNILKTIIFAALVYLFLSFIPLNEIIRFLHLES